MDRCPLSDFSAPETSAVASAAASPASATINLSREYMDAVGTDSYKEIWYVIRRRHSREEGGDSEEADANQSSGTPSSDGLIARVLQPNRTSLEEAFLCAPPNRLSRFV
ncbi:hypothetical protein ZIOFF_054222 [Zingiber officinale]|uniref:Uncharacterized protein n=1 Tax=Zingiber officinale TaxID=94328 RepID=A0A8J5KP69_ZINOF|nr:hypothetical protein ZIOFF_054222 [Zingiber officinale]